MEPNFVSPVVSNFFNIFKSIKYSQFLNVLSLLSNILLLDFVNTQLFIWHSNIEMDDTKIKEVIYIVVGRKFVHCHDHSLFMYL